MADFFAGLGVKGWFAALVLALLALTPTYAAYADNAFYLDIATRLIILAIAAVSLNLILGIGGMISFGHAAFLGIGSYAVGIPAYYEISDGIYQIPLAIALSALFAFVTGIICLRTKGVNFIMITMAFTQMIFFAIVSIEEYGGDDGLVINARSDLTPLIDLEDDVTLYYVSFISLLAAIYLVHRIVNSRFGMVIKGSKGNERRMQSLGFDTYRYRLAAYVIAGSICGYAGTLLGNFTGFISPEMMDWTRSGELIFMVVLGGAGSLFGPLFGAGAFILLEEYLTPLMDALLFKGTGIYWQFVFGIILILIVLFAKGGISGALQRIDEWRERRRGRQRRRETSND
jgi:branched-chain amino acid transport system permease protein